MSIRIVCPLPTPLRDGEELDVPALRRLIERLVPEVDAFFLLRILRRERHAA